MIGTTVGNLNFISQKKIVSIDLKSNPVQYGTLNSGQICGSALTRKPQAKKEPKGKKYTLPDNLETEPVYYPHLYYTVTVPDRSPKPIKPVQSSFLDSSDPKNDKVKKYKTIWCLEKDSYFYWTDREFNSLPERLQQTFIQMETEKKTTVPFELREFKKMSHRTRSKIESKLLQWQSGCIEYYKKTPDRVNFYFWTFTVPTRNFSHELTHRAFKNFMHNMGLRYRTSTNPVNYLWVAELQSGKRALNTANGYYELMQRKDKHYSHYKAKYDEFIERSMKPTNNIHYHVVLDHFYDIKEVQELWLTCLENQGCSIYTSTGKRAEPVDVQKVKNGVNGVSRYIAKYVSKNDGELKVQLWNCSKRVSGLATSLADCHIEMQKIRAYFDSIKERSLILC